MNTASANVAARLESVAGADRVSAGAEICDKYAVDGVAPSAVVKPASVEEVAEMVRFAKSEKLALIACGCLLVRPITNPAGIGLADLAETLAKENQFVPLAVPFFEECTVGGTIASGIGSMLRNSYGSGRDFLLGAEFVNDAGALTKSGGRVVKNVTGYDLHKLLIGSLGTLAALEGQKYPRQIFTADPTKFITPTIRSPAHKGTLAWQHSPRVSP